MNILPIQNLRYWFLLVFIHPTSTCRRFLSRNRPWRIFFHRYLFEANVPSGLRCPGSMHYLRRQLRRFWLSVPSTARVSSARTSQPRVSMGSCWSGCGWSFLVCGLVGLGWHRWVGKKESKALDSHRQRRVEKKFHWKRFIPAVFGCFRVLFVWSSFDVSAEQFFSCLQRATVVVAMPIYSKKV